MCDEGPADMIYRSKDQEDAKSFAFECFGKALAYHALGETFLAEQWWGQCLITAKDLHPRDYFQWFEGIRQAWERVAGSES